MFILDALGLELRRRPAVVSQPLADLEGKAVPAAAISSKTTVGIRITLLRNSSKLMCGDHELFHSMHESDGLSLFA